MIHRLEFQMLPHIEVSSFKGKDSQEKKTRRRRCFLTKAVVDTNNEFPGFFFFESGRLWPLVSFEIVFWGSWHVK